MTTASQFAINEGTMTQEHAEAKARSLFESAVWRFTRQDGTLESVDEWHDIAADWDLNIFTTDGPDGHTPTFEAVLYPVKHGQTQILQGKHL